MKKDMNYSEPSGNTEEIILDEEEFEALLAASQKAHAARAESVTEVSDVTGYIPGVGQFVKEYEEKHENAHSESETVEYNTDEEITDNTVAFNAEEVKSEMEKEIAAKEILEDFEEESDDSESGADVVNLFKDGIADKLIYLVGALIILMMVIVGVVIITGQTRLSSAGEDMTDVGNDVAAIGVVGGNRMQEIFTARMEKLDELQEASETISYDEIDEETGLVNVSVDLTSILKDIKIKFINKKNKLIPNIPFEAEVTDAKGKTEVYTDDDKDGMIYISGIEGGNYTVKMKALKDYDTLYSFSDEPVSIAVKNEIEYKKVDVSNEVKSDTDKSAASEDTKTSQTETEGELKDTVEFVLSSKTVLNGETGYEEIGSSNIPDPIKAYSAKDSAKTSTFNRLSKNLDVPRDVSGNENDDFTISISAPASIESGGSAEISVSCSSDVVPVVSWSCDSGITFESPTSRVTMITAGTVKKNKVVTISCSVTCNGVTKNVSTEITIKKPQSQEETPKATVKLDYSQKTIFLGDTQSVKLKPTVTGSESTEYTWASSDTGIVTVNEKGTLTPVKEGKATITVTHTASKAKASCEITVVLHPSKNTVSLLTFADGTQAYVYDSSTKKYREAKYADYYTEGQKFYKAVKVEYKYTGWQTLNGNTFFFDKNGNKVTGEQVILGTKYKFSGDGVLLSGDGTFGIDVSKWNGTIDWSAVSHSGVHFAIIRAGFRGSTEGKLYEDSTFKTNVKNATSNGIKVGVYFFTQAVSEVEAVEEASMILGLVDGYNISYPIFLDVESGGAAARAENLNAAQRTAVIKAFCKTIANSGYSAGVYANKTWFTSKINTSELTAYKIWLAQYNTSVTYTGSRYDMWQYSENGSINGIGTKVDLDRSYLGY